MIADVVLQWAKTNPTAAIASLSLMLSLYNLANDLISKRRNFRIRIYSIKSYKDVTYLHIGIENKSRLSIAVTQFFLLCGEGKTACTPSSTLLCETIRRSGKEITGVRQIFSTPMPIAVSAQSAFVLFEGMQELPADSATHLTVQVCSTRGRPVQMKLELPAGWASQRKTL